MLKEKIVNLDIMMMSLAEELQRVPAEITLLELDEKSRMVIELRDLKQILKEVLKKLNSVLVPAETHLCQTIAFETENGLTYRHELGTVTASARGFFEIKDAEKFWGWLKTSSDNPAQEFITLASKKKARNELCERLLSMGKNIPPGIKEHIIASVIVRRNKNGKD
jgi:6-pyruvoyl-tetrahydropterin synthase|tara:strand:- start:329 stop:826 length:498 start_codon:yes stop_codon:yes gene_type:complete